MGEVVDGDAPVEQPSGKGRGADVPASATAASTQPPTPPAPTATRTRKRPATWRWPRHENNRKNLLCEAFQTDECADCARGSTACPYDATYRHQCAICLSSDHGAAGHKAATGGKGKGKGKTKGKGKGKAGKKGKNNNDYGNDGGDQGGRGGWWRW